MLEFIDTRTLFVIIHLFGVAIGAGGAYMSDAMFMHTIKDKVINHTELHFLKLGSMMVWTGLTILVISGIILVSLNPQIFLSSTKLAVKVTIVAIITINGIIFHFVHTPILGRSVGDPLHLAQEFRDKSRLIYISGAISMTSWSIVIVLGALRGIPFTYLQGMGIYAGFILVAVAISEIARRRLLTTEEK